MSDIVKIRVSGCDDETEFDIEVTPAEAALLRRLSRMSYDASTYGCQPVIVVNDEILKRKERG